MAEAARIRSYTRRLEAMVPQRAPTLNVSTYRPCPDWVEFKEVKRLFKKSFKVSIIDKELAFLQRAETFNLVASPKMVDAGQTPKGFVMTQQGRDFIRIFNRHPADPAGPIFEYSRHGLPVLVALVTGVWVETEGLPAWLNESQKLVSGRS